MQSFRSKFKYKFKYNITNKLGKLSDINLNNRSILKSNPNSFQTGNLNFDINAKFNSNSNCKFKYKCQFKF